jgi:dienelactone hydrolase
VPVTEEIALAGVLHLPEGTGAFPAVVLYPGSQGSRNLPAIGAHLAANGIVALELEKRGVAGSGGSWHDETIDRQASDLMSAVGFVRARPEVDTGRIGVAGHSQGGWVAQVAAARSPEIRFLVLLAGPAQTVREQILTDERNHLVGWGVPPAEADERIGMFGDLLDAAMSNPAVCGSPPRHYLCGIIRHDPQAALAGLRIPVLALFGERDPMTPPDPNVAQLQAALAHLGPGQLTIHVFPAANHIFRTSRTGLRDEYSRLSPDYVPGFLDMLTGWIRAVEQRPGQ